VKMPNEHAKQPAAKRTLIIRKFCTLADPTIRFSVGKRPVQIKNEAGV
jgi:hypothetical protein